MSETSTRETLPEGTGGEAKAFICRCEEILDMEIVAALVAGARTVDDVKRRTRAGMGICQGIFCSPTIAAMLSEVAGTPIGQVAPMTARPPTRPVALEILASFSDDTADRDETAMRDTRD